ncbi:DUF6266 family protein [Olivibacter sp. 47]|uniref:DUF6266 family protein n=1 Tax=Olivibacter sp. 47 TaxID=3056486 RepID=UPI0025A444D3|nr:DUF6266 family protein [Olivibacter sp. 47]MDM8173450.1 DUF6266 family protein [Olivibacter sp. 47]
MEWISKIELPKVKKEPNGRLAVQQRFKIAMEFLAPLGKLLQSTYSTRKRGKSAMGRAMSKVLSGAIEGVYPNQYVNPAKVLLSEGTLMSAREIALKRDGNTLTATFNARWITFLVTRTMACSYVPIVLLCVLRESMKNQPFGRMERSVLHCLRN